jgi:hypothetical protein
MAVTLPTRLDLETELQARLGALLYFVYVRTWVAARGSAPSIIPTGTNALYNGAIAWALDLLGVPADSPAAVGVADMARIPVADYSIVCDLAEYRLIANALGNYVQPDESASGRSQAWGSLRNQFQSRLKDLEDLLKPYIKASRYTIGYGSIKLPIGQYPDRYGCL